MKLSREKFWHEFTKSQAPDEEIHENILDGMNVLGANSIILMCAILIASVGLNMNATAVIIGAMLISPLMGPITAIGYGVGTFNSQLIRKAFKILVLCVSISIVTSTLYFSITPITTAGSEILARTSPTIWDVIIAFVGGTVGMIGATRSKTSNVIPGVAIATALMPPLCTAGYGLASRDFSIFLGAGYLFFINCFFIITATFLVTKLLHLPVRTHLDDLQQSKMKKYIIVTSIIVMIPSMFSALNMIQETINESNINSFIKEELGNHYVLDKNINKNKNMITLVVMGDNISTKDVAKLNERLPEYGFDGMQLTIKQDASNISDFEKYINEITQQNSALIKPNNANQSKGEEKEVVANQFDVEAIAKEIKAIYPSIQEVYMGEVAGESDKKDDITVIMLYTIDDTLYQQLVTIENWFKARVQEDQVIVAIQKFVAPPVPTEKPVVEDGEESLNAEFVEQEL